MISQIHDFLDRFGHAHSEKRKKEVKECLDAIQTLHAPHDPLAFDHEKIYPYYKRAVATKFKNDAYHECLSLKEVLNHGKE